MKNLRDDIAEMFAGLDGSDRYEDAIENWANWRRAQDALYSKEHRDHASRYWKDRYQREPEVRARHKAAVVRYLDRLLGSDRPRRTYGPLAIKHGSAYTYTKRRCRCAECRAASAAYQRSRRARMKEAA